MTDQTQHSADKTKTLQEFQRLPGVGIRIAEDLWALGYCRVQDLLGQNPDRMFERLCELQGVKVDRCMLYVFRCIVYSVTETDPTPALLKWWNWSDVNMKKRGY